MTFKFVTDTIGINTTIIDTDKSTIIITTTIIIVFMCINIFVYFL